MMRALLLAGLLPLLGGCATLDLTKLENRVACTLDGREAHVLSKWWVFSIGSQIASSDAVVICNKGR